MKLKTIDTGAVTDEMLEAMRAKNGLPFTEALQAVLEAAPEVEQEPIGYISKGSIAKIQTEGQRYIRKESNASIGCTIPVYTTPKPFDTETKRKVLELCEMSLTHDYVSFGDMENLAEEICERLK